jgi:glycosyltransferase involved in cell wall biosynthesis
VSEIISNSTTYELVLVGIFLMAFLIQALYYLGFFLKVATHKNAVNPDGQEHPGVTIVICARNEEENLECFLPSILEQKYPNYEVVVVNDCSSDNSDMVLDRLSRKYPHLRVSTIKEDEKFTHNKKLALTVGIKAAKNDWVLLTDADCRAESDQWLASMASNFDGGKEIVLGYGGYIVEKGFLNKLIRFDTMFIAMHYLGFALVGKPYMGVGRNLAYRRDLFFRNKGFASHSFMDSGDDDLFVNEVATGANTAVEFRHESHTRSVPRKTFGQWVAQKRRHITTGNRYRASTKWWLAGEVASRFAFFASAIALIALLYYPFVISGIVLARWALQLSIIKAVMNRLNERKILLISLLYDLWSLFFYGTLLLLNSLSVKRSRWR